MLSGLATEITLCRHVVYTAALVTQLAGKQQCTPILDGNLVLMGKGAHAVEDEEEQQSKTPHVALGIGVVIPSTKLLLCHFWRLNPLIDPVRHALQVRGHTTAYYCTS